jgi:hypothetical protein
VILPQVWHSIAYPHGALPCTLPLTLFGCDVHARPLGLPLRLAVTHAKGIGEQDIAHHRVLVAVVQVRLVNELDGADGLKPLDVAEHRGKRLAAPHPIAGQNVSMSYRSSSMSAMACSRSGMCLP